MDVISAIVAGLVGTAVMTLLIYTGPMMGMPKMDMVRMLGTMLTPSLGPATGLGGLMHFMTGAVFGVVYAALWTAGIGSPEWYWGLIFGAAHGVVAALVMPMMLRMHPRRPEMQMGAMTVMGIMMGHLVFGLLVAVVYGALAG